MPRCRARHRPQHQQYPERRTRDPPAKLAPPPCEPPLDWASYQSMPCMPDVTAISARISPRRRSVTRAHSAPGALPAADANARSTWHRGRGAAAGCQRGQDQERGLPEQPAVACGERQAAREGDRPFYGLQRAPALRHVPGHLRCPPLRLLPRHRRPAKVPHSVCLGRALGLLLGGVVSHGRRGRPSAISGGSGSPSKSGLSARSRLPGARTATTRLPASGRTSW